MALQSELFTSLMDTSTPLVVVDPDLLPPLLPLQLPAYPPKYNEMEPPYTCAKTSRHMASHTHRRYDAVGANPKALTLEPVGRKASARRRRVRSGKLKQAGCAKTYD